MNHALRLAIEAAKLAAASAAVPAGLELTQKVPGLETAGYVLMVVGVGSAVILTVSWLALAWGAQFDALMPRSTAPDYIMRREFVAELLDDVVRPIADPDTFSRITLAALNWAEKARGV